jgi:MFS family permease
MTGVALPLIAREYDLQAVGYGLVSSATVFGVLVGATALGGLADKYGRKNMFIAEMAIFLLFLILLTFTPNFVILLLALFGIGIALGCDYPTAHLVISESISARHRGRMVLGAFSFQALGAFTGIGISLFVLSLDPAVHVWRWMYAVAIIPAIVVFVARFYIVESAQWLAKSGRLDEARDSVSRLLKRQPVYPREVTLAEHDGTPTTSSTLASFREIWRTEETRRATILASVPWFLQDISTYGIGIFTPVLLADLFDKTVSHNGSLADVVQDDIQAAQGTAMVDVLLIVGIVFAILLTDRVGRIKLQIFGFVGCAVGLTLGTMSSFFGPDLDLTVLLIGFMLFNFMTNLGPNAQSYLIAGEVFPTQHRAVGAGFAASFGKIGAVLTAFLFPVLLAEIGQEAVLAGLVGASLLGAIVTWKYRIETKGINLEEIDLRELDRLEGMDTGNGESVSPSGLPSG